MSVNQPIYIDELQWAEGKKKLGIVGCFREEEEEVAMKLKEMVEVARIELATSYSIQAI